ncbi:large ribosomal subunit protein mL65 [Microcaecilia unicolor]|uniref:39S ribosomal protein S30, mitochondrial n=1 Tax=Microcaecilia unicolor TaxID=1415580 RepID=A0A6P7WXV7_9AMPH|nr:39S ribosomal protein S30, mitochondrial [Microcaecilia unicolor]
MEACRAGSLLRFTLKVAIPGCRVLHTEPAPPSPLYPPVVASLTARSKASLRRRAEEYRKQIYASQTVAEKLRLITKVQRLKFVVPPQTFALGADRWYQSFTKTVFLPGLPESVTGGQVEEETLSELRSSVCHALLQEHFYLKKKRRPFVYTEQRHYGAPFLNNMVSSLTALLGKHNPQLRDSSLDIGPQVNFFWLRGERVVPRGHRRRKVDPIPFQIDDNPQCQIRMPVQLPEFVPLESSVPGEVPVMNHSPDKMPLFKRQYENKIFIGTKTHDPYCYGHTQFHLMCEKQKRERLLKANLADQIEIRYRANAIASLFAWTGAQAMYQGFWSHADVTRPFVSQGVIYDGKYFAFFCYQLNTLALSVETDVNDSRKNICWGVESMPLYETVEDDDVKGFNDEVLKQFVRFLLNSPKQV